MSRFWETIAPMPGTTIRRSSLATCTGQPTVKALAAGLLLAVSLSACGSDDSPEPKTPPQAALKAAPAAQRVVPGHTLKVRTSPLTGRRAKPSTLARPVLTVKIENSVDARPQTGLAAADLVVEELVEGGITRFAAMFQSRAPRNVGPVRSVRNVDASLTGPTHGLFAYSGGAGHVLGIVGRAPVQQLAPGQAGNAYHRSSVRRAPHNLYANARKLYAHAHGRHRMPAAYLPFAPNAATAATTAGKRIRVLKVRFSTSEHPTWTYHRTRHHWMRSEGSRPARAASGARLVARNVIVLRVRTKDAGYRDPAGNFVPETVLKGSGPALLATGGRVVHATWHKKGRDRVLRFTGPRGRAVRIAPGRTWLELVPRSGSVTIH
jgi:Protein of unknown function (DUF3048) N-terminal domain/Protein of unknown function (DUF3048) C-terminal domain